MDDIFGTFHFILSFVGVRIYAKSYNDSVFWFIFQCFNVFVGFLTFIFTTGYVIVSSNDILLWIEGTGIWATGVIMFISLCVCLVFNKDFRLFLEEMGFVDGILKMPFIEIVLKAEKPGKMRQLKRLTHNSQAKLIKYTTKLLKTYVLLVWLTATLYILDPIYAMLVTEDDSLRLLGFKMWFPWSLKNLNVYVASFIFHAYAGYLCCIAYPGLQSTIIFLNCQVIRQLKILSFILSNLDLLVVETLDAKDDRWQQCTTALLSQCIDHWIKLKSFTHRLNKICRYFYLTLIIVAILLVCVCSVKIAISNKLAPDTMKYYVHEICFIIMVLLFCTLGQEVQNECENLELAVLEKWYNFDRKHKTIVKIFHMALGRQMPIYIFGSITLSLPTFTWFIKTGMSFFTLVMSVFYE